MRSHCLYALVLLAVVLGAQLGEVWGEDLYRVLGVSRSATIREIKRAYKNLAKLWHPDKNKSPEAQDKILQINKAYEILTDNEKRNKYDLTGDTGESPNMYRDPSHGFTVFQAGNSFHFRFNTRRSPRNDVISTRIFFTDVVPNSNHRPYLLNFFHDFCHQCMDVEVVWEELRRELGSDAVGLGSIHVHHQGQVTHYCGVSWVPTVVAVVSGRVVHYQGVLSVASIKGFLEAVLPSQIVTELTLSNADPFLSLAIERNRPRVILFSPRPKPSLHYKLLAFAHQKSIDFAYLSTDTSWYPGSHVLLRKFGIPPRHKQALVFKEFPEPALSLEHSHLTMLSLRSTVEEVSLFLPRLSSPLLMDAACPFFGSYRLCAVLLVPGPPAYNDSVTAAFRGLARQGVFVPHFEVGFAYLDVGKQEEFLKAFAVPPALKRCSTGETVRPVLILKRVSNLRVRYDWFGEFCGMEGEEEGEVLERFLSATKLKNSAQLADLQDEEAPGFLGRMWNKMVQFIQNISDFISAIDPHVFSPLMSFLFAAILLCLVGTFAGPSEDKSVPKQLQRPLKPLAVYRMDAERHAEFVESAPRGTITLVLLVNGYMADKSKQLQQTFRQVVQEKMQQVSRLKLCCLCYKSYPHWFPDVLRQCDTIDRAEANDRVTACYSERMATVLALITKGERKQVCIFPEVIENSGISNGNVQTNSHTERSSHGRTSEQDTQTNSVGRVLSGMLGFEDEDSNSDMVDDGVFHQERKGSLNSHSEPESNDSDSDSELLAWSSGAYAHRNEASSDERMEQLSHRLWLWLEKLQDGTLRHHDVDGWPAWRQ